MNNYQEMERNRETEKRQDWTTWSIHLGNSHDFASGKGETTTKEKKMLYFILLIDKWSFLYFFKLFFILKQIIVYIWKKGAKERERESL